MSTPRSRKNYKKFVRIRKMKTLRVRIVNAQSNKKPSEAVAPEGSRVGCAFPIRRPPNRFRGEVRSLPIAPSVLRASFGVWLALVRALTLPSKGVDLLPYQILTHLGLGSFSPYLKGFWALTSYQCLTVGVFTTRLLTAPLWAHCPSLDDLSIPSQTSEGY